MSRPSHHIFIKQLAQELGFLSCGIARAGFLEDHARPLERWLKNNGNGSMSYMANHFDMRLDPRLLVPGAKSVISLTFNYYTTQTQSDPAAPKISKYALGKDYHKVIKRKLKLLLQHMRHHIGDIHGRAFVDSAPILERAWATRAGLGWQGKNTNVISPKAGSFFFLAELIVDLELEPDSPFSKDYCGTCTRCLDACPTQAITAPNYVDARKCISYLTIELKESVPSQFKNHMQNWAFGCDVCQDVCPWNRFSVQNTEPAFTPTAELLDMTKADFYELTEETFNRVFEGSAVKRAKYHGLQKNIQFLQ